jgi:hypothetical protein
MRLPGLDLELIWRSFRAGQPIASLKLAEIILPFS